MSGLFGMLPGWMQGWFQYAKNVENIEIDPKDVSLYIAKSRMLGEGGSKKAFSIEEKKHSGYCFTLPSSSAISKFCLVEYKKPIKWVLDEDKNYDEESEKTNEVINELKKMYELSMEINGRTFAPKLEQIKIDDVTNTNKHVEGTPFPPENMDAEFEKIEAGTTVKISYLIERCDYNIIEFISRHEGEIHNVCEKIDEFIHSYVHTFNELNTDIKSENLCPTIVDGSVKLIRLLDVDPRFCIQGDTEEFKHNAEVLMKYQFLMRSAKIGYVANGATIKINFGNFGLTQNDVDNMIRFFYKPEYMKEEYFNPIAMLYNYSVYKHPNFFLKLPEGWVFTKSETKKKLYFFNEITKQTQWEHPYDDLEKYDFLPYDELMKHFTDVEKLIRAFQIMNKESDVVLRSDNPTIEEDDEDDAEENITRHAKLTSTTNKKGSTVKKASNKLVSKSVGKPVNEASVIPVNKASGIPIVQSSRRTNNQESATTKKASTMVTEANVLPSSRASSSRASSSRASSSRASSSRALRSRASSIMAPSSRASSSIAPSRSTNTNTIKIPISRRPHRGGKRTRKARTSEN